MPGGFIAVELFLSLSGFLIGSKLLLTFKGANKDSFWKFFRSRLAKFYPALIATIILTLTLGFFASSDLMTRVREHTAASLTFSTNIVEIVNGGTYETQMIPNVFEHLWFLALLMQLYIIGYFFIWVVMKMDRKYKMGAKRVSFLFLGLAVFSYILMGLYGGLYGMETRAYFGTDTHAGAFFLGIALASATMGWSEKFKPVKRKFWSYLTLSTAIGVTVAMSLKINYSSNLTFSLALPLMAVITVFMIISVLKMQSEDKPGRVLGALEYMGSASFYIYLFHWPLFILLSDLIPLEQWIVNAIVIVSSVVLALLMNKAIMPGFKKLWGSND